MDRYDEYRNREAKAREFARNRSLLNKCQKRYRRIIIAYGFSLIFFPLFSLFLMLGSVFSNDTIFLFFESLFVYSLTAFFAWKGAYRKRDFFVFLAIGTVALNQLALYLYHKFCATGEYLIYFKFDSVRYSTPIHLFLLAVFAVIGAVNIKTNIVLHMLEKADGYPHFSERYFEQDMTSRQLAIQDPYQRQFEELKRTASDSMSDLPAVSAELEKHTDDHRSDYMDDV